MIKLLKQLNAKQWIGMLVCLILIASQVWLDLELPEYMSKITTLVQTDGNKMSDIWTAGIKMLGCALGSLILAVIVSYIASRITAVLAYKMREKVYNKVASFSMEEIKKFSTSSLITRTTNDVTQVQMVVGMMIQLLAKAPIMATWAICKIANKGWEWSVATASAVGVLIIMLSIVIIFAVPKFKKIQRMTDSLNRVTRENLTGVRVVRAYNAEDYQEGKFAKANKQVTDLHLSTSRVMAIMNPGMTLIANGLSLSIYWIGAYLIYNATGVAKISIFADMVVYMSYAMQVVMSFMMLVMIFMMLPRASVSSKRINEVLDTQPKVVDGAGVDVINKGTVEFKYVSFKYPDAQEYVIRNVNFTAKAGETVAFIGSTGSGKSTLINLIPRFYDATEGEILIDGKNVKEYTQQQLHDKIGYVPQKAVLFKGTIASNIDFGDNSQVDQQDIEWAAEIAQAKEFIEGKNDKYEAEVAQNGTNLSGGQKQRVAIARAIARKPEIFIFDDSFSALDYKTDKILRTELKKNIKGATTFIVAQRIGTILDADKIVVLDQGDVVGMGTHEELLKTCNVYQEIAYSQLSKEELENG